MDLSCEPKIAMPSSVMAGEETTVPEVGKVPSFRGVCCETRKRLRPVCAQPPWNPGEAPGSVMGGGPPPSGTAVACCDAPFCCCDAAPAVRAPAPWGSTQWPFSHTRLPLQSVSLPQPGSEVAGVSTGCGQAANNTT